jgi:hypothetical protein
MGGGDDEGTQRACGWALNNELRASSGCHDNIFPALAVEGAGQRPSREDPRKRLCVFQVQEAAGSALRPGLTPRVTLAFPAPGSVTWASGD